MQTKHRIALVLVLLLMGVGFGRFYSKNTRASSDSSKETIVIDFWHSMTGEKRLALMEFVGAFNSLTQNQRRIRINAQYVGSYSDGIHKFRAALIAKKLPHIIQIYEIGTQVLIDSDATVPLADLAADDPSFGLSQILPQIASYYSALGKIQALPFATSNPVLYVDREALKKAGYDAPPRTWEELFRMSEGLSNKASGISAVTWPLNGWVFEQFLAAQNALFALPSNGRGQRAEFASYQGAHGVDILTWMKKMADAGYFSNVGRNWDPPVASFMARRSAMLITSTSDVFVIKQKAPFPVDVAPLPLPERMLDKVPREGGLPIGGNALWLTKGKPLLEQQAAYEFLKFMASSAVQKQWHQKTGYFPIRADAIAELRAEGFYEKHPEANVAIEQLMGSASGPAAVGAVLGVFPEAREHVETAMEKVLSGETSVEEGLQEAAAQTTRSLGRYNRLRLAAEGMQK